MEHTQKDWTEGSFRKGINRSMQNLRDSEALRDWQRGGLYHCPWWTRGGNCETGKSQSGRRGLPGRTHASKNPAPWHWRTQKVGCSINGDHPSFLLPPPSLAVYFHELHTTVLLLVFVNHGKNHIQVFFFGCCPLAPWAKKNSCFKSETLFFIHFVTVAFIYKFFTGLLKSLVFKTCLTEIIWSVSSVHNTLAVSLVKIGLGYYFSVSASLKGNLEQV